MRQTHGIYFHFIHPAPHPDPSSHTTTLIWNLRRFYYSYRAVEEQCLPAAPELDLKLQTTEENQINSHRNQTHSWKNIGAQTMSRNLSFWFSFPISRMGYLLPVRVSFWWIKTQKSYFRINKNKCTGSTEMNHISYLRTVGDFYIMSLFYTGAAQLG